MNIVLTSSVAFAVFVFSAPALAQDDGASAPTNTPPPAASAASAPPATAPPDLAPPALAPPASLAPPALPAEKNQEGPKDRSAYISISPFHLIFPIVEVTAEIRLHERIGVAAIAGIGSIDPYQFSSTKPPAGLKASRFTVWEVGGQFVSYPIGHFDHGMQLGAEILYGGVAGSVESSTASASATSQGLSMGPFVGYKFTAPIGFALSAQVGAAYATARADAKGSTGQTASGSDSAFIPILNLNLGWAF